jgi:hypothetical protein
MSLPGAMRDTTSRNSFGANVTDMKQNMTPEEKRRRNREASARYRKSPKGRAYLEKRDQRRGHVECEVCHQRFWREDAIARGYEMHGNRFVICDMCQE